MIGENDFTGDFELPGHVNTPEGKLMLAMLERAILDYVGNDAKERDEANNWLFDWSESDIDDPHEFSFPWVCDYLGLDPSRIAATVKVMPKRGENRVAPWYFAPSLRPLAQNKSEGPRVLGEKRYLKAA
jgi:hypothetical protein